MSHQYGAMIAVDWGTTPLAAWISTISTRLVQIKTKKISNEIDALGEVSLRVRHAGCAELDGSSVAEQSRPSGLGSLLVMEEPGSWLGVAAGQGPLVRHGLA